jgi:hypothetical protein
MKTNRTAIQVAFVLAFGALAPVTQAAVFNTGDILTISSGVPTYDTNGNSINVVSGSWFGCDCNANSNITGTEKTPLSQGTTGIIIGYAQPAGSASHAGAPLATDTNAIDTPWSFFGNTGMHFTASPVTGDTITGLDFTGWRWSWNGIYENMGGGAWGAGFTNGVANISWDGIYGHAYTLDYAATVPLLSPTGFGGVKYKLHLEGTVNAVPIPTAVWLFGSGLVGLFSLARRKRVRA